ncbi:hypothetical protein PR048_027704 [Dryococelus australis]|uniref:Uncharacterized protein n=1 Tax=Dryococelus australis TaxID=614101 RepID=A0ABQ9GH81_9NEOP|nr:hypothetical protein PR048_027704 [Dryococelus australis]
MAVACCERYVIGWTAVKLASLLELTVTRHSSMSGGGGVSTHAVHAREQQIKRFYDNTECMSGRNGSNQTCKNMCVIATGSVSTSRTAGPILLEESVNTEVCMDSQFNKFETRSEIGSKIDTENCYTIRVQSWTGDHDEVHFKPPKLAVRNLDLRSAAIVDKWQLRAELPSPAEMSAPRPPIKSLGHHLELTGGRSVWDSISLSPPPPLLLLGPVGSPANFLVSNFPPLLLNRTSTAGRRGRRLTRGVAAQNRQVYRGGTVAHASKMPSPTSNTLFHQSARLVTYAVDTQPIRESLRPTSNKSPRLFVSVYLGYSVVTSKLLFGMWNEIFKLVLPVLHSSIVLKVLMFPSLPGYKTLGWRLQSHQHSHQTTCGGRGYSPHDNQELSSLPPQDIHFHNQWISKIHVRSSGKSHTWMGKLPYDVCISSEFSTAKLVDGRKKIFFNNTLIFADAVMLSSWWSLQIQSGDVVSPASSDVTSLRARSRAPGQTPVRPPHIANTDSLCDIHRASITACILDEASAHNLVLTDTTSRGVEVVDRGNSRRGPRARLFVALNMEAVYKTCCYFQTAPRRCYVSVVSHSLHLAWRVHARDLARACPRHNNSPGEGALCIGASFWSRTTPTYVFCNVPDLTECSRDKNKLQAMTECRFHDTTHGRTTVSKPSNIAKNSISDCRMSKCANWIYVKLRYNPALNFVLDASDIVAMWHLMCVPMSPLAFARSYAMSRHVGGALKAAAWGDRDMRTNSLIASTRRALNWRAVLLSITRLYQTFSGDPNMYAGKQIGWTQLHVDSEAIRDGRSISEKNERGRNLT